MVRPQELQEAQWVTTPEVKPGDLSLMSFQDTHRENCSTKQSSHFRAHAPSRQTGSVELPLCVLTLNAGHRKRLHT